MIQQGQVFKLKASRFEIVSQARPSRPVRERPLARMAWFLGLREAL
jgi:hypothetical protein